MSSSTHRETGCKTRFARSAARVQGQPSAPFPKGANLLIRALHRFDPPKVASSQLRERRQDLSRQIDTVYEELVALVKSGAVGTEPEYLTLQKKLGALEHEEAAAFLLAAEAQLEMPLDAGHRILEDLRREEARLANLASKKRSAVKKTRSAS